MYSVFRTAKFDKELEKKFSRSEISEVENFERKQLTNNPYVGDPLSYRFFREKKLGGKRVYYLIYDELKAVLMVATSDKKTQRTTIDEIRQHLDGYHQVIEEAIKQHGEYGPP